MDKKYYRYFTYIQPVLKNHLVRTYGYIIFTIVMTTIFIIFAIKPTVETIAVLTKQLDDQKEILAKLDKKTQDLAAARANYQQIPGDVISKIDTAMPTSLDIKSLTASLEESTLSTQATISAIQFQPIDIELTPPGQNIKEVDFTFNIEGTYDDVKTVLNKLKSSPRVITISDLIFNKIEGQSTILMSATGKAYYVR